jgi:NAD(P)-dependent dehydrogenase (short-subunit alcohol dehydrogenase family)
VAVIDIDPAGADGTTTAIGSGGGEAIALLADVSVEDQIARAASQAADHWGGIDIVVANAAVEPVEADDRADRLDTRVWRRVLEANLTGAFLTCKYTLPLLLASRGCVVCTASPTGRYGLAPGEDAYSASKAGVYGLIRVMARSGNHATTYWTVYGWRCGYGKRDSEQCIRLGTSYRSTHDLITGTVAQYAFY